MTLRSGADQARFVAGLMASSLLVALGTLLAYAAVPLATPGWTSTVVGSGSMAPALVPGDIVVVREHPDERLSAPAVVLAERPGMVPLLHRVVAHDAGHGYRTKGDANRSEDGVLVPDAAVIGVARAVIPWVGWPSLWLQERNLRALGLALTVLMTLVHLAKYGWAEKYDPWRVPSGEVAGNDPSAEGDIAPCGAHSGGPH